MSCIVDGSTIVLTGTVGDVFGGESDYFDARDIRAALKTVGKNRRATVYLNSGGGLATEGPACAALFTAHPGRVDVIVEGIAASAASVAACGADTVIMALGATWMLHEAAGVTVGTSETHKTAITELRALNASMAEIYAAKSGRPTAEIQTMMAAETWLTADEAVRLGFADKVLRQDEPAKPARFAYSTYKHAPRMLMAYQGSPTLPAPVQPVTPPAARLPNPDAPADPAAIADMCVAAEQTHLTAALIRERVTVAQAEARLNILGQIRPMMTMVEGHPGVTEDITARCLSGRMSVAQAREEIFEAMAAADEAVPVDNKKLTGNGEADGRKMMRESMVKQIERNHGPEAASKARAKLVTGTRT